MPRRMLNPDFRLTSWVRRQGSFWKMLLSSQNRFGNLPFYLANHRREPPGSAALLKRHRRGKIANTFVRIDSTQGGKHNYDFGIRSFVTRYVVIRLPTVTSFLSRKFA